MERTLVVIKPDGVQRALVGRIIQRFEDAGLKVVASKMRWVDEGFAAKHYFDVEERHGTAIFKANTDYMSEGPVVAMVLQGVEAVANVRRIVGGTEPKGAAPGTIRGDFAHVSYGEADATGRALRNLIHASGAVDEADYEIKLWFDPTEIHDYEIAHSHHVK